MGEQKESMREQEGSSGTKWPLVLEQSGGTLFSGRSCVDPVQANYIYIYISRLSMFQEENPSIKHHSNRALPASFVLHGKNHVYTTTTQEIY
jgi:hypothetical protein